MGYSTDFSGSVKIEPPLTPEQVAYINKFGNTRRMKRNPEIAAKMPDPVREAVGLPIGEDGGYFTGGLGSYGQDDDESVIYGNGRPAGQPGLWCQWEVTETELRWNGGEKFYSYVDWLKYLIQHFFKPWGRVLNGEIEWYGEDCTDTGIIEVKNNEVASYAMKRVKGERLD